MRVQLSKRLTWRRLASTLAEFTWRGVISTSGLYLGVLIGLSWLLRLIEEQAGVNPNPAEDAFYSTALYGFAGAVIVFSMWGSNALREALERGLDWAPRGSLRQWLLYGAFAVTAVAILASVQWLHQEIRSALNEGRARGEPWYRIYDALQTFLGIWVLVLAYKCKIFWDVGIRAVARPNAAAEAPRGRDGTRG